MTLTRLIQISCTLVLLPLPALGFQCHSMLVDAAEKLRYSYAVTTKAEPVAQVLVSEKAFGLCSKQITKRELATELTKQLKSIVNDKHLAISFDPVWIKQRRQYLASNQNQAFADSQAMETPADNYGFKEVKMLAGNIGYLDIRAFADSHLGGETAASAMKFLQYADGIIIDLRNNFGGSPFMIQLLASYFFDQDTQHLTTAYSRSGNQTQEIQNWTLPFVPGPRFPNTPLYILTSHNTASAAEWFSYALKNLGRATLIGEKTAGAAHARRNEIINDNFVLSLPNSYVIDPRTNDNFEQKGITPTITTSSDQALLVAHNEMLKTLIDLGTSNIALHKWVQPVVNAKTSNKKVSLADLTRISGDYGHHKIFQRQEKLYYQYDQDSPFEIEMLNREIAVFKAFTSARLEFIYQDIAVTGIKVHYQGEQPLIQKRS